MFKTSALTAFASFRLVNKASYSAILFVTLKFSQMEYSRITPSPLSSIIQTAASF